MPAVLPALHLLHWRTTLAYDFLRPVAWTEARILTMTKRMLLALVATALTLSTLSACNTIKGVGKDIQRGGEALEKAADR